MKMIKNFAIPALLVAALFGALIFSNPVVAEEDSVTVDKKDLPVINVSGQGQVTVEPDKAQITIGVSSDATTADQAQKDNAATMNKILTALDQANIDKKDIQTSNFSVQPRYDYSNNRSSLIGYQVRNNVVVTVKDLDKLGSILDGVRDAGANDVSDISFQTSQTKDLYNQALALAVADARSQAEVIAKALGKTIDDVVIVSAVQSSGGVQPMYYAAREMMVADNSTPIMAGELDIKANVTVQYSVK